MPDLFVPKVAGDSFGLELVGSPVARIRFTGNGDTTAIAPLEVFLRQVHDQMRVTMRDLIEVDLGELYIMNSSCMKQFISWIYKVDTGGRPYKICFCLTPRLRWQGRTVATFQRLAPTTVVIRELQSIVPPPPQRPTPVS